MPLSFRDMLAQEAVSVFLNEDDFAEPVEQWPRGVEGAARSVTARWKPDDTPTREANTDGEATTTGGSLWVAEATETHDEDQWVIGDEHYTTLTRSPVTDGLRRIDVTRADKFSTSRHRTKL